jgi:nucleoporin NUP159
LSQGAEGPKKLALLKPWPTDRIPPASATLLSIASKPGLLAAAGPEGLIITSTDKVRKAFEQKAGEWDVISDFTPDLTIPTGDSPLRHVAFSADGDFLVVSAEANGGLAVFAVEDLKQGKQAPGEQIKTDDVAVRVLQPNPMADMEQYMAVVLDNGKLCIADVTNGVNKTLKEDGVSCVTWSSRGKAVAAGMQDGTTAIYMSNGDLKGVIPCPPEVDDNYEVTGLTWVNNTEFLIVHSPKPSANVSNPDNKYHLVECEKGYSGFQFHPTPWDPLLTSVGIPPRPQPSRLFTSRLSGWEPDLNELLIMTTSHTDAIIFLTSSSKPISPEQGGLAWTKWIMAAPDDRRKAAVPRLVFGEEGDSALVGEALDLSATEKILRPIASLEEINEAPHPLPAYMILTHQGVLMAWWVLWNKSIEAGTCYPHMTARGGQPQSTPKAAKSIAAPSPAASMTPRPASLFGEPSTPASAAFGGAGMFAKPAATFGTPTVPSFGAPGLGSTPPFLPKASQPFGSTTPASDKPSAPAFGAPSAIGGPKATGFGVTGGMGNKQSLWGAPSQPAPTSQAPANPFSAPSGGTGFAKFGQAGGASAFTSFGSNSSGQSAFGTPSGFGALGQQQKSAFPGLKTEPSGSTVTLGSGTGSSLPSWAGTPAQQGGSVFGHGKGSFNTSSFESKSSDTTDAENRKRDEATPTPQAPPQASKGLFGLGEGFKMKSNFQGDGSAKDDLPKPAGPSTGSLFGGDFASALGGSSLKPLATPAKDSGGEDARDLSTTPGSPPRQQKSYFPSATPAKESATPKAAPPAATTPKTEDAPLPPDFLTTQPPQSADDDLPPLAGSPGVKVEAPSSSVEASPIDKDDDDEGSGFSEEEEEDESGDEEEEVEEPSPSAATRRPQSNAGGWNLQQSVNQSPRVFPPAPTPPAAKSGATSTSDRSASPAQPIWGQSSKPAQSTSLFGPQPSKTHFSLGQGNTAESSIPGKPLFPPPTDRVKANLRSPSPVRSASTSAIRTRREPIVAPGSTLSASVQQAKPPTPEPQVSDLQDEEDERMRAQLSREVEPSRTLDEFTAYQNYAGQSFNKSGHAAQIEMVYKDINGMIDSLGWNARSIKSYTEYHKQPQSGHKVNRQTLEDIEADGEDGQWFEQWTIGEVDALKSLEKELEHALDAGRVQDVLEKLGVLAHLLRDKANLMTRLNGVRQEILNRKDPDRVDASRKAPLNKDMSDKQKELRLEYARLTTQLHQAEEAAVVLRSRIASHNAQNGQAGAVPTVDAVKKTIVKMTAMAEQRNNDITVLESQMRKIGLAESSRPSSSSSRNPGTPRRSRGTSMRNSIAETPFSTPPTGRSKTSSLELNRRALTPEADNTPSARNGYGLYYTPADAPNAGTDLARLSDLVEENIDDLRETAKRRKQVALSLKRVLGERGVKATKVA